jgi:hypothetical protein
MSYVTLPFRIRPSRVRLATLGGVLAALAVPMLGAGIEQGPLIAATLAEPSFTWPFAGAVAVCGLVGSYVLSLVGFVLVAWPGAPFLYVDVDEGGVTYRRLWHVARVSFRDTDGWGYVERVLVPVSADVPAGPRLYTVVAGRGGYDGHLVRDDRPFAMHINVLPFTPLFESRASFAEDFALCLTAALRGARQARRPVTINVAPWIAELSLGLGRRFVRAARAPQPRKAAPARLSGRVGAHDDTARADRARRAAPLRASDGDNGARR